MIYTFDELIQMHIDIWTNTTKEQQVNKWFEEREEFLEAEDSKDKLGELADMFIVSAGIARFDYAEGLVFLQYTFGFLRDTNWYTQDLLTAVAHKMQINKNRTWKATKDTGYHHTEE